MDRIELNELIVLRFCIANFRVVSPISTLLSHAYLPLTSKFRTKRMRIIVVFFLSQLKEEADVQYLFLRRIGSKYENPCHRICSFGMNIRKWIQPSHRGCRTGVTLVKPTSFLYLLQASVNITGQINPHCWQQSKLTNHKHEVGSVSLPCVLYTSVSFQYLFPLLKYYQVTPQKLAARAWWIHSWWQWRRVCLPT